MEKAVTTVAARANCSVYEVDVRLDLDYLVLESNATASS
jgi:hypothetical protein